MADRNASDYKAEVIAAVAAWADRVANAAKMSRSRLAKLAGLSDTTVTRGMSADAASTPKLENLHAFARAAGVPSVVDFLRAEAGANLAEPWLPKPETIADLLAVAMHVDEGDFERRGELLDYANAVHIGLRWIAEDPASENDPGFVKGVRRRVFEAIAPENSSPSQATLHNPGHTFRNS